MSEMTDYLDKERKKLWAALSEQKDLITSLKAKLEEVSSRTPEEIAEAKANSEIVSTCKDQALEASSQAENAKSEINAKLEEIKQNSEKVEALITNFNSVYTDYTSKSEELTDIYETVTTSNDELKEQIQEIAVELETCTTYVTKSKEINTKLTTEEENCASLEKKILSLHQKTLEKHNEVKDLYDEIFGYDAVNEKTGETERVEGLKDELDTVYETLKKDFKILNDNFKTLKNEKEKEFQDAINEKTQEFQTVIDNNQKKYDELFKKIESLLPGAMSAGLSTAYHTKREAEIKERNNSDNTFYKAIKWLTGISLVPFGLGAYLLWGKGLEIQAVIHDMPRIAMATLPLYAPTLWVAYSSNRKSNLSKRLIEEYTHKEALSKTFEGLSKQIENLDDENSQELKVKLLYAIVSTSSENPGALIKGYNKSDHPFMDIIDKSVNLTNSLEKLSKIPAIGNIAHSILEAVEPRQEKKIMTGLSANNIINGKDEDEE